MNANTDKNAQNQTFVNWFRHSSPYINAFRGRVFVIAIDGEAIASDGFHTVVHDIALLNSLGVRLVLVHGLKQSGSEIYPVQETPLVVTDSQALARITDQAGSQRFYIESLFSMGLANSPMAGADIRVSSGNHLFGRPIGIKNGIDYCHTGRVRRVDTQAIGNQLQQGSIVLLSTIGYSPTGELFSLSLVDCATAAAAALKADKLIYLSAKGGLTQGKELIRQLNIAQAKELLQSRRLERHDQQALLNSAIDAVRAGVRRVHLLNSEVNGALLLELFTRDGIGTLITSDIYEGTRDATIDDVGGILELISPLETSGVLVRRSRELLETEIDRFAIMERDGMIIACAALYPFPDESVAELACMAVHTNYRNQGRGEALLQYIEHKANSSGIGKLFVLTTEAAHWFLERGFYSVDIDSLPVAKQATYNYQRRSKVYFKDLNA